MKPIINIMIRTSSRPISFKRLIGTIKNQTCDNYNFVISVDNDKTAEYVKECGFLNCLRMDKNNELMKTADLYFNYMIESVKGGFVWGVDDDDFLPNNSILEIINNNLKEDMINIFKMKCRLKGILPREHIIKRGQIGTPCFIIPVEMAKKVKWKAPYASDFTYIRELSDLFGKDRINWVDEIIYEIDKPNQGETPNKGREI
jgi:hypothetical protein